MSVPITYRQKMDFGSCVQMVGFPKYGHEYICRKLETGLLATGTGQCYQKCLVNATHNYLLTLKLMSGI